VGVVAARSLDGARRHGGDRRGRDGRRVSGIGVSLRIVFAVVLGGMYSLLGPTVGAALTIVLSESLRIAFGLKLIGMAETIYGLLLVLFIIFLPSGIWGSLARPAARATPMRTAA
jgi:branched-chain amino acid transport system permease protein